MVTFVTGVLPQFKREIKAENRIKGYTSIDREKNNHLHSWETYLTLLKHKNQEKYTDSTVR